MLATYMMHVAAIAMTAEPAIAMLALEIIICGNRIYEFCCVDNVALNS
jgi:hypothetical protein